jgi:hypothetical protein
LLPNANGANPIGVGGGQPTDVSRAAGRFDDEPHDDSSAGSTEKMALALLMACGIVEIAAWAADCVLKTYALSRGPSVRVPNGLAGASQRTLPPFTVALTTNGMPSF